MKLHEGGIFLVNGNEIVEEKEAEQLLSARNLKADRNEAKKGTIAYGILEKHNNGKNMENLQIKFDAMVSHDITYVGIIQTARASGMEKFPLPYVLTCCHNSLCAVGGTINDDDHYFGLSAVRKYGGIFVPPHIAVCHQFMREEFAGCGKMILGSDSHTRYGALGTMAIGEGGGELSKQLLRQTYDVQYPGVIAIYLTGKPQPFVGPHDIALAICRAVYKNGYVKNKVMEFVGPGVSSMSTDFRNGVDVMTTETTCLSSIWRTDEDTKAFLTEHKRGEAFTELNPKSLAYYDGCIEINLSEIRPMIALPFHPSNAFRISELYENLEDILRETEKAAEDVAEGRASFTLLDKIAKDHKLQVQQGIIAGCAGGNYTNVIEAAHALKGKSIGSGEFYLSVYPSSQPVYSYLDRQGVLADLMDAGAVIRSAFCGPCFGAGDTPANNALSIRHTTRNFPNREGSKPGNGQMSAVALMDARSIAATAANGGRLTSAEELGCWGDIPEYHYDNKAYLSRVFQGYGRAETEEPLRFGPNIKDWPEMEALADNVLLKISSKILDEVTTTDELIPSGETSSYRSNPLGLAEFTLSRRDPEYVGRAKNTQQEERARLNGTPNQALNVVLKLIHQIPGQEKVELKDIELGSSIYANKPGDGSAREQAASCQRVLGALANITKEYATKRYRSNCMNWGMLPLHLKDDPSVLDVDDYIYIPGIRQALSENRLEDIRGYVLKNGKAEEIRLYTLPMTENEREIVQAGSLINFNKNRIFSGV